MSGSKNSNSGMAVPEAKEAMRQFKEEVASELGLNYQHFFRKIKQKNKITRLQIHVETSFGL